MSDGGRNELARLDRRSLHPLDGRREAPDRRRVTIRSSDGAALLASAPSVVFSRSRSASGASRLQRMVGLRIYAKARFIFVVLSPDLKHVSSLSFHTRLTPPSCEITNIAKSRTTEHSLIADRCRMPNCSLSSFSLTLLAGSITL